MALVPTGAPFEEVKSSGIQTLRAATLPTNSYVACTNDFLVGNYNRVTLLFTYIKNTATSVEHRVEFSQDGIKWFKGTNRSIGGGITTINLSDPVTK